MLSDSKQLPRFPFHHANNKMSTIFFDADILAALMWFYERVAGDVCQLDFHFMPPIDYTPQAHNSFNFLLTSFILISLPLRVGVRIVGCPKNIAA